VPTCTRLSSTAAKLSRALLVAAAAGLLVVAPAGVTAAHAGAAAAVTTLPPTDTTNPFLPEEASLGDCLSALPPPNCGSEARGGFAQWSVLAVLVAGLTFIGWRVVRGARRNSRAAAARIESGTSTPPTPQP
jgi:hypothetical protein